jgi:hypothetical protein
MNPMKIPHINQFRRMEKLRSTDKQPPRSDNAKRRQLLETGSKGAGSSFRNIQHVLEWLHMLKTMVPNKRELIIEYVPGVPEVITV